MATAFFKSWGRRIRLGVLLGACLVVAQAWIAECAWAQAQAGVVRALSGKLFATNAAGVRIELLVGTRFGPGTTFQTGEDERIEVVLADGQVLIVGRNSRFRVEQFQYGSRDPKSGRLTVSLEQGSMRFIGGNIANSNPAAVRIFAGASVVGLISGSAIDFTVVVDTRVDQAGMIAVARGEVSLTTPFGNVAKMGKDQVARWQPSLSPAAAPHASLPAALLAEVNAVQTSADASGQAGVVRSVSGTVVAQTPAGERMQLSVGAAFREGTTFFTGNNESAELVLSDGQIVLLGQKTIVRIDRFEFDRQLPNQPNTSVFGVTVLNSVMRFVGGIIATGRPESVNITAGDATIGIRPSEAVDFSVAVGVEAQGHGAIAVRQGELTLTTPSGTAGNLVGGQGATWQPGLAPLVTSATLMPPAVLVEILGLQSSVESSLAVQQFLAGLSSIPPLAHVVVSPGGGGGCVGSPC